MFGTVQTLEAPYTFENIGLSCLTLFRCATGEDWHRLMFACYDGPYGAPGAIIFWVIYESVMVFVLLNMFVMVIVTAFDEIDAVNEVRACVRACGATPLVVPLLYRRCLRAFCASGVHCAIEYEFTFRFC